MPVGAAVFERFQTIAFDANVVLVEKRVLKTEFDY